VNTNVANKIEKFWEIFENVMGKQMGRQCQSVTSLGEWDSLSHVELIFEMERELEIEFCQDDIAKLYSSTDVILEYIRNKV